MEIVVIPSVFQDEFSVEIRVGILEQMTERQVLGEMSDFFLNHLDL